MKGPAPERRERMTRAATSRPDQHTHGRDDACPVGEWVQLVDEAEEVRVVLPDRGATVVKGEHEGVVLPGTVVSAVGEHGRALATTTGRQSSRV